METEICVLNALLPHPDCWWSWCDRLVYLSPSWPGPDLIVTNKVLSPSFHFSLAKLDHKSFCCTRSCFSAFFQTFYRRSELPKIPRSHLRGEWISAIMTPLSHRSLCCCIQTTHFTHTSTCHFRLWWLQLLLCWLLLFPLISSPFLILLLLLFLKKYILKISVNPCIALVLPIIKHPHFETLLYFRQPCKSVGTR